MHSGAAMPGKAAPVRAMAISLQIRISQTASRSGLLTVPLHGQLPGQRALPAGP